MWVKRKRITTILFLAGFYLFIFLFLAYCQGYPYSKDDRNPLNPLVGPYGKILVSKEIDIEGMSLEGIIYSKDEPVAVINGDILKEQEKIGKYTIIKIEGKKIILEKDNKKYTLKLEDEE